MKASPTACLFPGQGSQKKGMGAELFERYDGICEVADSILGYSVKELCLENPGRKLSPDGVHSTGALRGGGSDLVAPARGLPAAGVRGGT